MDFSTNDSGWFLPVFLHLRLVRILAADLRGYARINQGWITMVYGLQRDALPGKLLTVSNSFLIRADPRLIIQRDDELVAD